MRVDDLIHLLKSRSSAPHDEVIFRCIKKIDGQPDQYIDIELELGWDDVSMDVPMENRCEDVLCIYLPAELFSVFPKL